MKKLFLLFGLLIFIQPFLSAQTLNITFSVNQEKVLTYKNQIFELIYTVKNDGINRLGKDHRWEFPTWTGVELLGEPSKSTTTSFINGKRQFSIKHIYYFIAKDTGTFVFAPATFFYKDKMIRSNPVEVEVLPELPLTDSLLAEKIFLKLELHPSKAMVGEQVRLDIRAYSHNLPNTINYNGSMDDLEMEGIYFGRKNYRYNSQKKNIMVDGIVYPSRVIFSKDIYAYHAGDFKFPRRKITVSTRKNNEQNSFTAKKEILVTDSTKLEVYALAGEENPYPSVNGSHINFNIIDTALQSGILYLDVSVKGKSDPMYFAQPYIGLEKVAEINLENTKEKFSRTPTEDNEKTFQYKISFLEKGTFEMRPEWTTWNTKKKKGTTISADPKTITVTSKATTSTIKIKKTSAKNQEPIPHAIILAVDLSSSMLTKDFSPSRMALVQERLKYFFKEKSDLHKYAIVGFAGETELLCPLTSDFYSLTQSIDKIEIGKYVDGTAIGDGLMHSIKVLSKVKASRKTIVLITDGVQNSGKFQPLFSSKVASVEGIRIVSLGIGSDKNALAPIKKKSNGEYVYAMSGGNKIDESTLKIITQNTNGTYLRVLDEINFDDSLFQILLPKEQVIPNTTLPIDQKLLNIYFQNF